jgi:hypothetical protein
LGRQFPLLEVEVRVGVLPKVLRSVGVDVEVGRAKVAEGSGFEPVDVFEGEEGCTFGMKGLVVMVGMIAVRVNSASAVVVAAPLRKILFTESVGVGIKLLNRVFPSRVPTRKYT